MAGILSKKYTLAVLAIVTIAFATRLARDIFVVLIYYATVFQVVWHDKIIWLASLFGSISHLEFFWYISCFLMVWEDSNKR